MCEFHKFVATTVDFKVLKPLLKQISVFKKVAQNNGYKASMNIVNLVILPELFEEVEQLLLPNNFIINRKFIKNREFDTIPILLSIKNIINSF